MTARAEEIAADVYPDLFIRDDKMKTSGTALISDAAQMLRREGFINGYKQGQQDRWIPVAMIHNDYDASVRCSNCGDTGGFGVYDDLEWAKHCPGCGRPISEQVSAKGVRTPHPLYTPPNPEQR